MKNYFFADEILYSRNFLKKPNQLFETRMDTNNDERALGLQVLYSKNFSFRTFRPSRDPRRKSDFQKYFDLVLNFRLNSSKSLRRTARSGTKFMHLTDKINAREIIELCIMWQKIWNVFEYLQKHKLIETCDV